MARVSDEALSPLGTAPAKMLTGKRGGASFERRTFESDMSQAPRWGSSGRNWSTSPHDWPNLPELGRTHTRISRNRRNLVIIAGLIGRFRSKLVKLAPNLAEITQDWPKSKNRP